MISIPISPIFIGFFSVIEQIRSGELLHKAIQRQQEEKRKLQKLNKEQTFDSYDRNIESEYMYTDHIS